MRAQPRRFPGVAAVGVALLSTAISCGSANVGTRGSAAHDGGSAEAEASVDGAASGLVPAPGSPASCACPPFWEVGGTSCCLANGACGLDEGHGCVPVTRPSCAPLDPPFDCNSTPLELDQFCIGVYISQPDMECTGQFNATGQFTAFTQSCLTSTCCDELSACMDDPGCRSVEQCASAQCDATKDCMFNHYPCVPCPGNAKSTELRNALEKCAVDHCGVF